MLLPDRATETDVEPADKDGTWAAEMKASVTAPQGVVALKLTVTGTVKPETERLQASRQQEAAMNTKPAQWL